MSEKSEYETLTLANVNAGKLAEQFEVEVERLLENIEDPNTEACAKRVLTVKLTFKPDEERNEVSVVSEVGSKLAPVRAQSGTVFVGRRQGALTAIVHNIRQQEFEWDPETPVRSLDSEKKEAVGG